MGITEFTSTSQPLLEAVCELVESLGGIARRGGSRITKYEYRGEIREGRRSWRANLKVTDNPFWLARKRIAWVGPTKYLPQRLIESIEPDADEKSVCIKIDRPDGLYLTRHHIVTHNTVVSMALAAELFESGEIDLVMHVARRNKVDRSEFPADWAQFTTLRTLTYHGPTRAKRLAKEGVPDVLITTYETGRAELMTRIKRTGRSGRGGRGDGPLMEALGLRDKRVLWIFDECTKLANRRSELYQSYEYVLKALRQGPHRQRVLALSATPMRTDYEQPFNIGRIVWPEKMPTVTSFEGDYTYGRDDRGRLLYKKGAREWFAEQFQPLVYRKRRTDPDVRDQMPQLVERLLPVDLLPAHAALYRAVGDLYGRPADELSLIETDKLNIALRLTAGHPAAHLRSGSELSKAVVAAVGEEGLRAIPSSKSLRLIEELETLVNGQGDQVLVFTFYAETVLPELVADLRAAGFAVATYTGGQSTQENEAAKESFKSGQARVLVSSDAGSEGLNLPEAHYIIEFDCARTYDTRTQRFGRGTRITSGAESVYALTMVARKSIEVGTLHTVLSRNQWQDTLLGDTGAEGHMDAADRRRLLLAE
jgi:superfamily II DNA or RNA helicase